MSCKNRDFTSGPEGNRSHKFASRLATPPPHFVRPAGPIVIQATKKEFPKQNLGNSSCGPEGNRTPNLFDAIEAR